MAATDETLDVVRLSLLERGVEHTVEEATISVAHGSAKVEIEVIDASSVTTVSVRASVLSHLSLDPDAEFALLRRLNELNAHLRFGKFYVAPSSGDIVVEYEILASHMQPEELFHAVSVVSVLADDYDDLLVEQLGQGRRAIDLDPAG